MKKIIILTLMALALAGANVQQASAGLVVGATFGVPIGGCYSPGYCYSRPAYNYGYNYNYCPPPAVVYAPPPVIYRPPVYVAPPVISFGFGGYYGGYRHHSYHRPYYHYHHRY